MHFGKTTKMRRKERIMFALVQAAFYSGVMALILILLLPLVGLLAVTVVYLLCDLLQFILGRTYLP